MARDHRKKWYYYADGQRVALTPADDLLALDEQHEAVAGLSPEERAKLEEASRPLRGGLRLVPSDALARATRAALERAGALQPVFRAHGSVVVALPEVRIEESRPDAQERLKAWVASHGNKAVVRSQSDGAMVLAPVSGHGEDALALANALAEEVAPEMAQPRFIRVTPRPSAQG